MIRELMRRGSGYLLATIVAAVTGLAVMVTVTRVVGAGSWVSIAVGQSVGAVGALVLAFGWPVTGPARIAATGPATRRHLYATSLIVRGALAGAVLPIVGFAAYVVGHTTLHPNACAAAAMGTAVTGLGATWFFVGESSPRALLLREVLPRLALYGIALATLAYTRSVFALSLGILGAESVIAIVGAQYVLGGHPIRGLLGHGTLKESLRAQTSAASISVATIAYVQAPLILVAAGGWPTHQFAAADRLQKMALTALVPMTQVAQGHVPGAGSLRQLMDRVTRAIQSSIVIGALAGTGFLVLAPVAAGVLTGGQIDLDIFFATPFALCVAAITISGVVGPACLVPLELEGILRRTTFAGALAATLLCPLLGLAFGTLGIAWGVAGVEGLVAATQCWVALRAAARPSGSASLMREAA